MIYIGIDPGVSGGLAWVEDEDGLPAVGAIKMPAGSRDLLDVLGEWSARDSISCRAVVEKVHAGLFGKPGRMGVSSAFTFGQNVGRLHTALAAAQIPFDEVPPRAWQKRMGVVYPKGATPIERKNISKARAQQLFPRLTITHALADALLLAEYCRRVHNMGGSHGEEDRSRRKGHEARSENEEHEKADASRRGSRAAEGADPLPQRRRRTAARHGEHADQGAR